MRGYHFLVLILSIIIVVVAIAGNKILLKSLKPQSSLLRFIAYFIIVLAIGFLLTIFYSSVVLKLMR